MSLSNPYTQTVTVQYATEEGTAKEHRDFNQTEGTVTFAPGETTSLVSVATKARHRIGGNRARAPRQFSLVLSEPQNADLDDSAGQASIERSSAPQDPNGDTPIVALYIGTMGISGGSAYESPSGSHVTFTVHGSPGMSANWETADGEAVAGEDYVADSGWVYLGPGEHDKEILIDILDDEISESDEHFSVVLSNPSEGVEITGGPGIGTIIDNDIFVKIEAIDNQATEPSTSTESGDSGRFRITRYGGNCDRDLAVYYAFGGNAGMADYQPIDYSVTILAGEASAYVDVVPLYDGVPEGSETVRLMLVEETGYLVGAPDNATVTINDSVTVGQGTGPTYTPPPNQSQYECQFCSCTSVGFRADFATGSLLVCYLPLGIGYASGFDPQTMLATDVKLQPTNDAATLSGVEVATNFGGIESEPVYYSVHDIKNQDVNASDIYRFGAQIDASTFYPGRYDWEMTITQRYSDSSTRVETFTGQRDLINGLESPIGTAWGLKAQAQLFTNSNGISLMSGPEMLFFSTNDEGGYTGEDGAATLGLTGNWANGFVLAEKDGTAKAFNSAGRLTTITDASGNATSYGYNLDGSISQITDPSGHATNYGYTNGLLSQVTTFDNKVTTIGHDASGHVTTITEPDPDGGTNGLVWEFKYEDTGNANLLTSIIDPDDRETTFAYNSEFGTLETITYPGSETQQIRGVQPNSLFEQGKGDAIGNPSRLKVATNLVGTLTNEAGDTTTFKLDRYGKPVETNAPDPDNAGQSITTTYERNLAGLVTKMTEDKGGSSPRETSYEYDTRQNLEKVTLPDGTEGDTDNPTQTWTYDATFNKATSFTDESGHQTLYTIDPQGGTVESMRQVIGLVDGQGNTETDDLVTSYTYTPYQENGPPAGLVATITDPLLRVTQYTYNAHGLVTKVERALGIAGEQTTVEYGYDSNDDMTTSTDELQRVTNYEYDNLHRLTKVTGPDPDGASGTLNRPVTDYEYYDVGWVKKVTEPDPQSGVARATTDYLYDGRGRVTKVTRPDHVQGNEVHTTTTETTYTYIHDEVNPTNNGLLEEVKDAEDHITSRKYDTLGQLICVLEPDPDGPNQPLTSPETHYAYDDLGRLVQMTDPRNQVTTYQYELVANIAPAGSPVEPGLRVTRTDPDPDGPPVPGGPENPLLSPVTISEYDVEGRLRYVTDPLGHVTEYQYDGADRLEKLIEPDPDGPGEENPLQSPITTYAYDKVGNLRFVTDPRSTELNPIVTETVYDNLNRPKTRIMPAVDGVSPTYGYTYYATGQLETETDPLLHVTTYEYDAAGRTTKVIQPDPDGTGNPLRSPTTISTYDGVGNLKTVKTLSSDANDDAGLTTTYEYDALGNLTGVIDATNNPTYYTYDGVGNRLTEKDPLLHVTTYEYDALNRTTKVIQPDPDDTGALRSPTTIYGYDAVGNLKTVKTLNDNQDDGPGFTTSYDYDYLNRLILTTDAQTGQIGQTSYTYDAAGNRLTLTDPDLNTTTWTYDGLNRVKTETNELDLARQFEYDAAGNLTKRTDRNGRVIEYEYDNLSRRTYEYWKDGETTIHTLVYLYDADSRLWVAGDLTSAYVYSYDNADRATSTNMSIAGLSANVILGQEYDRVGNRTQLAATIGGMADLVNDYQYNNVGRMTRVTQAGQGGNAVAPKRVDFGYDVAGRPGGVYRYAELDATEMMAVTVFGFDDASRLTNMAHVVPGNPVQVLTYAWTFDRAGRITQEVSSTDGTAVYGQDETGQLTSADYTYLPDQTFGYDANGNRNAGGFTVEDTGNNRMDTGAGFHYEYDNEGNRTRRYEDNNANGVLDTGDGQITVYGWDYRNRLVSVTDYEDYTDYYAGDSWQVVDYVYDYANRLVKRTLDPDGDGGTDPIEQTAFAYDGDQILLQFEQAGAGDLDAYDLKHRYLWGPAVDQILADEPVGSLQTPGTALWPLTDHLGTVRDLVDYVSGNPQVICHRVHDAFGNLISQTNPAVDFLFDFTGRMLDMATGLQYNLNRWYDALAGRWLSEDPIGTAVASNLFVYCTNDPVARIDPFGLLDCECKGKCRGLTPFNNALNAKINSIIAAASAATKPFSADDFRKNLWNLLAKNVSEKRSAVTLIEEWIGEQVNKGSVVDGGSQAYLIPWADCMAISCKGRTYCIGSDKIGHFFQQGHMLYEIASDPKLGDDYAMIFSQWTEGALDRIQFQLLDKKYRDWLTRGSHKFYGFSDSDISYYKEIWGRRVKTPLPLAQVSYADMAANKAGMRFWKDLMKGLIGGKGGAPFDICNYMTPEWEE